MVWSDRYSSTSLYFQSDTSIHPPPFFLFLSFSLLINLFFLSFLCVYFLLLLTRDRFFSAQSFERIENKRRNSRSSRRTSVTFAPDDTFRCFSSLLLPDLCFSRIEGACRSRCRVRLCDFNRSTK